MRIAPTGTAFALSLLTAALFSGCVDHIPTTPTDATVAPAAAKQGPTSGRILFMRADALLQTDIVSMDDDGTNVLVIPHGPGSLVFGPGLVAWAPDGKRVLFSSHAASGVDESIYSANSDGTGITRLTYPPLNHSDFAPHSLGKFVAFERWSNAGVAIWAVNYDDGTETQLTAGPQDGHPAPSPSGKLLAFVRGGDIYVLDISTGAITNLTKSPSLTERAPAWSPGGKEIAFELFNPSNGRSDIYVMFADGTNVTQLTNTSDESESFPKWSPDGKRLAFTLLSVGSSGDIWVMNADGTGRVNLTPNTPTTSEYIGAWSR